MANDKSRKFLSSLFFIRFRPKWWMLYDALIAVLTLKLVGSYQAIYLPPKFFWVEYFLLPFFFVVSGNIFGLYDNGVFNRFVKLFLSLLFSAILAVIGLVLFRNVFLYEQIGRYILLFIFIMALFGCGSIRFVLGLYIKSFATKILFVGNRDKVLDFRKYFDSSIENYILAGYCSNESSKDNLFLGTIDEVDKLSVEQQIDTVVVDDLYITNHNVFNKCVMLLDLDCKIMDKESFVEYAFEQVDVDSIDPAWFYRGNIGMVNNLQIMLKKFVDLISSVVGLVFTAVVFPIIYLAIKIDSSGPVIYSQIRSGLFGKEFRIYKFRTMYSDAEVNGPVWAKENDDRITKVGSVLRKTRLDELPQFWNVLIGDMSVVGPRPERPELIKKLEDQLPYFYFRHLVRPGITGFAQIKYRYGSSVDESKEKLKYDLYYVKNWSFLQDLQIILGTIARVMKGSR